MKWLLLIVGIILIMGPLRRPFFKAWRLSLPAFVAGYIALFVSSKMVSPSDPFWFPYAIAVFVGLGVAIAVNDVLGKEK